MSALNYQRFALKSQVIGIITLTTILLLPISKQFVYAGCSEIEDLDDRAVCYAEKIEKKDYKWFEKNYSLVHVVELLRLSFNAGCTVDAAIANTLNLDVNNRFRRRLVQWLEKVQRGENIAAAAEQSGLGGSLSWAFDEKVNQGNTMAILETLESFYRSNYSYRVNLARFIMWPCLTIIMGMVVGFVVYAIFSPMVEIIHTMSGLVTP